MTGAGGAAERTRRYTNTVPLPLSEDAAAVLDSMWPVDEALFVWLVREGFERQAESESLELIEFYDLGEVPPELIPAAVVQQLVEAGGKRDEFTWRGFIGVARRSALSHWFEAAAMHYAGQDALAQAQETETGA